MKIKGINHKSGSYQGRDYDNYQFFGTEGDEWLMVKVSSKVVANSGVKDISLLINKDVEILYNRFGNVEKIRLA